MTKVYISGHSSAEAKQLADELASNGIAIVSTWHAEPLERTATFTEQKRIEIATHNWHEIAKCNSLVMLACPDMVPGGKFVEAGIALGMGKQVVNVGRRENMMMWHVNVEQADDLQAILKLIRS